MSDRTTPHAPQPLGPEPGAPPHLADPRAMAILSTEHWSLLSARSLVYNEAFSRGGMFLTLLSASLVALGFVYQGGGGGADFPLIVTAVLAIDLFVGFATLGRIAAASVEEFRALQGMNRIRHAYLEMVPDIRAYLSTSSHDDADSVLEIYGGSPDRPSALLNAAHGLTTMVGMIGVLNAAIAGALVASGVAALGGDARVALLAGIATAILVAGVMLTVAVRGMADVGRHLEVRFPPRPPAD